MFAEVFTDCRQLPSEKELHRALDSSFGAWKKLVGIIKRRFPEARQQWRYYNTTRGWVMIIRNHSHTLLYLAPGRGSFSITILLSEDVVRKHDHVFLGKFRGLFPLMRKFQQDSPLKLEITRECDIGEVEAIIDGGLLG